MKDLLFFAICFVVLALTLIIRFLKGPSVADRVVSADAIDILADMALILVLLQHLANVFV